MQEFCLLLFSHQGLRGASEEESRHVHGFVMLNMQLGGTVFCHSNRGKTDSGWRTWQIPVWHFPRIHVKLKLK